MISPERLDLLQRQWAALLGSFDVPPADAYPPFDRLVAAYSEAHRHYHTLEHIAEALRVAGRLSGDRDDTRAVQLAVWFHDAVYDPRATDNEERSAQLVHVLLAPLGLSDELLSWVAALVRATAHLSDVTPPPDPETLVLLDADLAILGASEERYRRYAADVRREYADVPDPAYRAGRAAVLGRFLARPRIYHHPLLVAEGEEAARRNLRAELAVLTRGS
jgi:predicted metal-dependent HD superfamily phosphohydrolase